MSLVNAIRAAMRGGTMKSRLEEEDPEKVEEDPEKDAEGDDEENPGAEGDDPEEDAEDDEENPADGEEEEEKGMSAKDRKTFARGRRAERRRIAAILGSTSAEASPKLAAHFAFGTGMKAQQALAALKASDAPSAGSSLAARMAAHKQPKLGGAVGKTDERSATVAGVKSVMQALHPRKKSA